MRRWLRLVGVPMLGVGALAALGAGLLAWRLRRGPVPLDFLIPRITDELEGDGDWQIGLGGLELVWAAERRHAELRARDLRVTRAAGGATLALAAVRLRLGRRALLRGAIRLVGIELDGPALQLARDAEGHFAVRVVEGASATGWLAAQLARLRHVAVRDGRVDVVDEPNRMRWSLPHVDVDVWHAGGPLRVQASVSLAAGDTVVPLWLDGLYRVDARALEVDASAPGAPTAAVLAAWPATIAPEARAWFASHVSGGRIGVATGRLTGHVPRDGGSLAIDGAEGRVAFGGLVVRWLDTMPPLDAVAGVARFERGGVDVGVESGTLGRIAVGPATVRVGWPPGVAPTLAVDATCRGPLASVFDVLAREPIALAAGTLSPTRSFTGSVVGRLRVAFPLDRPPATGRLGLHVKARTTDAGAPAVVGDWDVSGGAFDVVADDRAVALEGTARVRGVPVTVRFEDRLGRRGSGRLDVSGRLRRDDARALGVEPPAGLDGAVDVRARVAPDHTGRSIVQVDADLAPASIDLPALALHKPAGRPGRAGARLAITGGTVSAVEHFDVAAGNVTVRGKAGRSPAGGPWSRMDADASFTVAGQPDTAALQLVLRADHGAWRTTITSRDLGLVLLAYGLDRARGGRLTVEGTSRVTAGGLGFDGRLTVEDTTLSRVPWLLRVISLASVRGLLDVGSAQTIAIDRIAATIVHRPPATIEIREGVASGPKMALHLAGTADRAADALDLRGTLLPSYYLLNQGAGRIPVLGPLINRATGGAIQGVEFTVRGRPDDPVVAVRPVSSLAPGVLRDWLRKLGL